MGNLTIDAVGFKAVIGGPDYRGSFLVDDALLAAMRDFLPVAPVHNAVYITAMEIFRDLLPATPMVAVFEPGFHATMPDHAAVYGVPYEWFEKHGVRRYGFHGSSHRYVGGRVPALLGRPAARPAHRLVPPGRQLVDLRDQARAVDRLQLRVLAAVRHRPRRAIGRTRSVCRVLHDGDAGSDDRAGPHRADEEERAARDSPA